MRYEPASPAPRATGCQPGARALGLAIKTVYPELQSLTAVYGCFNRRRISGSSSWSLHAEGRAIDVGVPKGQGNVAWDLACELVEHRVVYGTMRVMWDRHIWSIERLSEWRRLGASTNQHLDHIHVELFWRAAVRPTDTANELAKALRVSRL